MGAEHLKPSLTWTRGRDHGNDNWHERVSSVDRYSRSDCRSGVDVSQTLETEPARL